MSDKNISSEADRLQEEMKEQLGKMDNQAVEVREADQ